MSYAAAAYVAGYVTKKVRHQHSANDHVRVDPETGELVDLVPEFARMSRRPAIGRKWIEKYWPEVYPNDYVVVNGQKMKPPRYYDRYMDQEHPEVMEEVRHQRWLDGENIDDPKLIMKEKVHRARVALFSRRDAV